MLGMAHGERQHTGTDPFAPTRIPQPATAPGFFALRDFPGGFELVPAQQTIVVTPAQHKTGRKVVQGPQPQTAGVSAIEDMEYLAPPTVDSHLQQFLVLIAAPT